MARRLWLPDQVSCIKNAVILETALFRGDYVIEDLIDYEETDIGLEEQKNEMKNEYL